MPKGSIRAYSEELEQFGFRDFNADRRNARATFRANFTTEIFASDDTNSTVVTELSWASDVDLPDGLSDGLLTPALHKNHAAR